MARPNIQVTPLHTWLHAYHVRDIAI
jgi:hypothetical protein